MQTEHTLEIKKIIAGGNGLGYLGDGLVAMVPFVLAGELVRVAEIRRCSGYIMAELLRVLRPSPLRRQPRCRYFSRCGGCKLQHISSTGQRVVKEEIIDELVSRAHLSPGGEVAALLPSPQAEGYRHRVRFHLSRSGEIGFHRSGSNELVAVHHCLLAAPAVNRALEELIASGLLLEIGRYCRQVEFVCSPDDQLVSATLLLSGKRKLPGLTAAAVLNLQTLTGLVVRRGKNRVYAGGSNSVRQTFAGGRSSYTLQWDSHCFFQVNPMQNRQLVRLVLGHAGNLTGQRILDLFCGMGNFSIPLALAGAAVTGVEWNRHAIDAARKNGRDAGVGAITFIAADVTKYLQACIGGENTYDLLLLDPPRQGLGRAARLLPALACEKIIYISCDPATPVRDVGFLVQEGYHLSSMTPVDMFPQTHHIECVAVLEKN
ncbi:MAG TPA: class I SAM-dependent RNA methyltransferase [Desulfobulbus sp.]|nr:class I SAM-dependent RNA methyltransferase [Desulfobulbus sp.]